MTCKECELIKQQGISLYEDPEVFVVLVEGAAVKGHVKIYSKKHEESLDALESSEVQHLFQVGNMVASTLFDEVGAHGTNIILNEGNLFKSHIHLDILARKELDGLDFTWVPKILSEEEVEQALSGIKGQADLIGTKKEPQEEVSEDNGSRKIAPDHCDIERLSPDDDSALIRNSRKLP